MAFGEGLLGAAAGNAAANAARAVAGVEELREQVLIVRRNTVGIDRNVFKIGRALGLWIGADEPDDTVVQKPWAALERRVEGIEQALARIERMLVAETQEGGR